jgi:hypothetical protein
MMLGVKTTCSILRLHSLQLNQKSLPVVNFYNISVQFFWSKTIFASDYSVTSFLCSLILGARISTFLRGPQLTPYG